MDPTLTSMDTVLEISGLRTEFRIAGVWRAAADGVNLTVARGETLALVGESGCGKSITALSIMGLVPQPAGRIGAGSIRLDGTELVGMPEGQLEKIRGDRMAMIFQEPMTSLNPVMTIGDQVAEGLMIHRGLSKAAANRQALAGLEEVKIPSATQRFSDYPHQFSGGMRQRVMIAIALACEPAVLLADEPTTALDVTIQAQILELLRVLQDEMGTAILLITHDLAVIAETADRVAVMYAGRIVETGPVATLFAKPLHPYTEGLLRSVPRIVRRPEAMLPEIPGIVPAPGTLPEGCAFAPRCAFADAACHADRPALLDMGRDREVACWKPRHD